MSRNLCQLSELKLSCFGCCGNHYKSKEFVMKDIRKNTFTYKSSFCDHKLMNRPKNPHPSGVCQFVILFDEKNQPYTKKDISNENIKVICPLHPHLNTGKDYRIGYCDTGYICKSNYMFMLWDKEMKDKFIDFLRSKSLDIYDYSVNIDNGSLLKEFEEINNIKVLV